MKIILIAALLLPLPALACGAGEKPVFSCTTTKGKEIKVCQAPTAIKYSFGKPGQPPELTLSESNKTFLYEVDGGSASEYQTFTFKNGNTHYVLNNLSGSPPLSRTLTRRPIEAMRSVHVEAKEVQRGVQARCG